MSPQTPLMRAPNAGPQKSPSAPPSKGPPQTQSSLELRAKAKVVYFFSTKNFGNFFLVLLGLHVYT